MIPLRMMDEQDALPAMALSASVKVQSLEAVTVEDTADVEFVELAVPAEAVLEDLTELVVWLFDRASIPVARGLPVGTIADPVPEGKTLRDGKEVDAKDSDLWAWWLRPATNQGAGAAATNPAPAPRRRDVNIF